MNDLSKLVFKTISVVLYNIIYLAGTIEPAGRADRPGCGRGGCDPGEPGGSGLLPGQLHHQLCPLYWRSATLVLQQAGQPRSPVCRLRAQVNIRLIDLLIGRFSTKRPFKYYLIFAITIQSLCNFFYTKAALLLIWP